ncbi:MAG: RDD family protein [Limisphaerales bacterium]
METQYKIIGGDGREYGPATLDELKSWIRDGRVAGATPIWRSDTGLWSPAAQFGEIRGELTQVIAAAGLAAVNAARPAGFWARLGAYLVDRILLSIVCSFVWETIATMMGWKFPPPPANFVTIEDIFAYFHSLGPLLVYQMLVIFACGFLYEVIFNGSFGATLGKMAIGARIVRVDGTRIGYGVAAARWLAERLSDITCGIGYLLIAFREDKRALHDLLVGTRVIFVR